MNVGGCELADDCWIDLENEVWWRWASDGATASVGVLATFGAFAGLFREFAYRPVDGTVGRGRSVATVESFRFTGAVRLPVDGELLERNPALAGRPRLLNDRPYSDGWVVRVRPVRRDDPERFLARPEAVKDRLEATIRDRRIRCWPLTPDSQLNEVGLECSAVLAHLRDELGQRAVGEAVLLVTDDPTSPIEMVRWSDQTGYPVLAHRAEAAVHQFLIEKVAEPTPRRRRA